MGLENIKKRLENVRKLQIEVDTLTDEILYDLCEGGIDLDDTKIDYCDSLEESINRYIMKEIEEQIK